MAEYAVNYHLADAESTDLDHVQHNWFVNADNPESFLKGYGTGYRAQVKSPDVVTADIRRNIGRSQWKIGPLMITRDKEFRKDPDFMQGVVAGSWQAGDDMLRSEVAVKQEGNL